MTTPDLERLYLAHGAALIAFVRNLVPGEQDAEDVVQAIFLKLARNSALGPRPEAARAYLLAACRNEAFRRAKKRRREWAERGRAPGQSVALEPKDPQSPESRETCDIVAGALQGLPAEQREVVHLKLYEDISFADIGAILGIPRDTAASRYRYAMARLSRSLQQWKDKI